MRTHRASLFRRRPTRGRFVPLGRHGEASRQFQSPGNWQRNWRSGGTKARIHLRKPLSFQAALGLHGFEQLPSPCVAQTGRGTGTAEADVPSDPAHDCDSGPKEGHGERRSGDDATLPNGYHDRCLYAGTPGRRAATVNSIHLELMGTGTSGPQSAASGTRSSIPARQHPNQSDRVNMTGRTRDREPATGKGGKATSEPSAKKVLKFAAKLLPNGESGDLLNA